MLPAPDPQGEGRCSPACMPGGKAPPGSARRPTLGSCRPGCAPHSNGGPATPGSEGSSGPGGVQGVPPGAAGGGPRRGAVGAPHPATPVLPDSQTLLTPAGHASHHHSNRRGPHSPPAAADGVGSPGQMGGCGRTGLRPPQRGAPPLGAAPLTLIERHAPACPHLPRSMPSPVALQASSCPLLPDAPRAQGVCTQHPSSHHRALVGAPAESSSSPASRDPNIRQ